MQGGHEQKHVKRERYISFTYICGILQSRPIEASVSCEERKESDEMGLVLSGRLITAVKKIKMTKPTDFSVLNLDFST